MGLHDLGMPPGEAALRFSAHCPGVSAAIAGTGKLEHFKRNLAIVEKGPLPTELEGRIRRAFLEHGKGWGGMI